MDKSELKRIAESLSEIIERHVRLTDPPVRQQSLFYERESIRRKIDFLERALEILRIDNKYLKSNLAMEEFLQGVIEFDGNRLNFIAPERTKSLGSGTAPIRLQSKLLLFLLYRHNRGYYRIYDIIDSFIKTIWDHLEPLDFKRTKTGVIRCFTNTRFAANTLRKYGLLKYTPKVAYKTWVLSLPGMLVATKLMEQPNWAIPEIDIRWHFDLHTDIRSAFDDLKTYDSFVQRLATVCKPHNKVFEEFEKGSTRAYSLLENYWIIINNTSISKKDREKKSQEKLKEIEQDPEVNNFYDKFSTLVKVGDLLSVK